MSCAPDLGRDDSHTDDDRSSEAFSLPGFSRDCPASPVACIRPDTRYMYLQQCLLRRGTRAFCQELRGTNLASGPSARQRSSHGLPAVPALSHATLNMQRQDTWREVSRRSRLRFGNAVFRNLRCLPKPHDSASCAASAALGCHPLCWPAKAKARRCAPPMSWWLRGRKRGQAVRDEGVHTVHWAACEHPKQPSGKSMI